jgi:hypothetical protein
MRSWRARKLGKILKIRTVKQIRPRSIAANSVMVSILVLINSPRIYAHFPGKFLDHAMLKAHRASHGTEKYNCGRCDKNYTRLSYLQQHIAVSHPDYCNMNTKLVAFVNLCTICNKQFSRYGSNLPFPNCKFYCFKRSIFQERPSKNPPAKRPQTADQGDQSRGPGKLQ